jgi:hypothetical protein
VHPLRKVHDALPRLSAPELLDHLAETGLRIGSSKGVMVDSAARSG